MMADSMGFYRSAWTAVVVAGAGEEVVVVVVEVVVVAASWLACFAWPEESVAMGTWCAGYARIVEHWDTAERRSLL